MKIFYYTFLKVEMERITNAKATIEINAKALSMILCELWDIDNEVIYPNHAIKLAHERIENIYFKNKSNDDEAVRFVIYIKLLASYKYYYSEHSNEYNEKYYYFLHPIANLLFMLVNVFDIEKVKAHYMEEMEKIEGIIADGAYVKRCDKIKKVIDLFESIQTAYTRGLCIIASSVILNEENEKTLKIYFGNTSDVALPQQPV